MKTVVCGLGKCGSRMIVDLNAMIYGGKYSYELKVSKEAKKDSLFKSIKEFLSGTPKPHAKYISPDEVPAMHLGDPDNTNEVVNYCNAEDDENKQDPSRRELKGKIIHFNNYYGACGQYHIVGEHVMRNLMSMANNYPLSMLGQYIGKNKPDNASCFFLMFSAGGGTGCGTSTVFAEYVAQHAKQEFANLLVAGIAALPGVKESDNYKVSAGRFLTKFLSSERATSFDTVITVGNSIMESIERDQNQVQSQANIFAANIILSVINSSSKYNRSPINTDGPELRKNIKGLAYFCFAQQDKNENDDYKNLNLLARALAPVSESRNNSGSDSFEGVSINFIHPKFFPAEKWNDLVESIQTLKEDIASIEKGDQKALDKILTEKFPDPKSQLPLAMRSCDNVVVLRGIPIEENSSSWEQTILVSLLETLFPKATIHFYSTYHALPGHTLSLIPSGYMSYEIMDLISTYLFNVWETSETTTDITNLMIKTANMDEEEARTLFGEREMFERKYVDFSEILERTSGLFKLQDSDWDERYIKAGNIASMVGRVNAAIATAKKRPKSTDAINWDEIEDI